MLLALCAVGTGWFFSYRLKLRRDFLLAFGDFLSTLETNIRYCCDDIKSLVEKSLPDSISDLFVVSAGDFISDWCRALPQLSVSRGLKTEDLSLLRDFGRLLGTTDIQGQINHIELYKSLFDSQLKKSESEYSAKSRLYKLLGFFAGASLSIMFI